MPTSRQERSLIRRGLRYCFEPSPRPAPPFRWFAGVCRLVQHLGLEEAAIRGRKCPLGYIARAVDLSPVQFEERHVQNTIKTAA